MKTKRQIRCDELKALRAEWSKVKRSGKAKKAAPAPEPEAPVEEAPVEVEAEKKTKKKVVKSDD